MQRPGRGPHANTDTKTDWKKNETIDGGLRTRCLMSITTWRLENGVLEKNWINLTQEITSPPCSKSFTTDALSPSPGSLSCWCLAWGMSESRELAACPLNLLSRFLRDYKVISSNEVSNSSCTILILPAFSFFFSSQN